MPASNAAIRRQSGSVAHTFGRQWVLWWTRLRFLCASLDLNWVCPRWTWRPIDIRRVAHSTAYARPLSDACDIDSKIPGETFPRAIAARTFRIGTRFQ